MLGELSWTINWTAQTHLCCFCFSHLAALVEARGRCCTPSGMIGMVEQETMSANVKEGIINIQTDDRGDQSSSVCLSWQLELSPPRDDSEHITIWLMAEGSICRPRGGQVRLEVTSHWWIASSEPLCSIASVGKWNQHVCHIRKATTAWEPEELCELQVKCVCMCFMKAWFTCGRQMMFSSVSLLPQPRHTGYRLTPDFLIGLSHSFLLFHHSSLLPHPPTSFRSLGHCPLWLNGLCFGC